MGVNEWIREHRQLLLVLLIIVIIIGFATGFLLIVIVGLIAFAILQWFTFRMKEIQSMIKK